MLSLLLSVIAAMVGLLLLLWFCFVSFSPLFSQLETIDFPLYFRPLSKTFFFFFFVFFLFPAVPLPNTVFMNVYYYCYYDDGDDVDDDGLLFLFTFFFVFVFFVCLFLLVFCFVPVLASHNTVQHASTHVKPSFIHLFIYLLSFVVSALTWRMGQGRDGVHWTAGVLVDSSCSTSLSGGSPSSTARIVTTTYHPPSLACPDTPRSRGDPNHSE